MMSSKVEFPYSNLWLETEIIYLEKQAFFFFVCYLLIGQNVLIYFQILNLSWLKSYMIVVYSWVSTPCHVGL